MLPPTTPRVERKSKGHTTHGYLLLIIEAKKHFSLLVQIDCTSITTRVERKTKGHTTRGGISWEKQKKKKIPSLVCVSKSDAPRASCFCKCDNNKVHETQNPLQSEVFLLHPYFVDESLLFLFFICVRFAYYYHQKV